MSYFSSSKLLGLAGWLALLAVCPFVKASFAGHWNLDVMEGKEVALLLASMALPTLAIVLLEFRPDWLGLGNLVRRHAKVTTFAAVVLALVSIVGTNFWGVQGNASRIATIVRAAPGIQTLVEELERKPIRKPDGPPQKARSPFLIYLESDTIPSPPGPLGAVRLGTWWYRLSYPQETVEKLGQGRLPALPPLNPKTVVIITSGKEVERMIRLDDGNTIPGYRIWEVVTLIDIESGCMLGQSDRIWGAGAPDPGHHGSYSSMTGEPPSWVDEKAVIRRLSGN
ncbi:MAG: hypothetical protein ACLQU3_15915 [Limisphaerales bacterium]